MRWIWIALIAFTGTAARAQYGIGLAGASQCPYGMQPASGSIDGRDERSNLNGLANADSALIVQKKQRLALLDEHLRKAKGLMREVLTENTVRAIDEHYVYRRDRGSYQDCRFSGSGQNGPAYAMPGVDSGSLIPTPDDFCFRGNSKLPPRNTWWDFADDKGLFSLTVCDFNIPGFVGKPGQQRSQSCRAGMREYYEVMSEKLKIETEIAQLDANRRVYERNYGVVNDRIAEGGACPYCALQRRGYAQASTADSIMPMVGMLAMVGLSMALRPNQPPMGGPMMGPPGMYAGPGGGAFPGRPYPGMVPGYMGVTNGMYGAVPGGMGVGGFGCAGSNPYALGNPYGQMATPFMNGTANPWVNPYANNALVNPSLQNPMLMPGYGPGYGPMLGNGVAGYNPYAQLMNGFNNPMMNPYGGMGAMPLTNQYGPLMTGMGNMPNIYAPPVLPYMGGYPNYGLGLGNLNPYAAYNPYGTYNPYGAGAGAYNPYGAGAYNPYGQGLGYNPYGLGMGGLPGAYNPYAGYGAGSAYTNLGGGNFLGYSTPYGSPLGNYYSQMQMLGQRVQYIQTSPVYGGAAPPMLPFPGPGSYSTPGYNNTLPFNGGGGNGTPNIIRPW